MELTELYNKHNISPTSELGMDIRSLFFENLVFTIEQLQTFTKESSAWKDAVCMGLKLSPQQFDHLSKQFYGLNGIGTPTALKWANIEEGKRHLHNWLKKQEKPHIMNAKPKQATNVTSAEDKYNAFISHIKIHKSIPANADWIILMEYLRMPIPDNLNYQQKINHAEIEITSWAHSKFTINNNNKYTGEKTGGTGIGSLLKKSMSNGK